MRHLFIKIFLWFGIAMVVANVASFVTGVVIQRRSQVQRAGPFAPSFGILAQTAVDTLEKGDVQALISYLQRVEQASHVNAFVLNAQGQEVTGRVLPVGVRGLAERAATSTGFLFDFS